MKHSIICLAQYNPSRGDIATNIKNHIALINKALTTNADLIIFPELSLTGYEPSLAEELAIELDDDRLDPFQEISNSQKVTLIIGAPIRTSYGLHIGAINICPEKPRHLYTKQHLHQDELPYFVKGKSDNNIIEAEPKLALAICYELTIPSHIQKAKEDGAGVYLTSVAKSNEGVTNSYERLSSIAVKNTMSVLMVNSVGTCEEYECAGKSAVWNKEGKLIDQLNEVDEGILIYDRVKDSISYKWQRSEI